MNNYAEDMIGQKVEVGDTIVATFTVVKTPSLRVGVVEGFGERSDTYGPVHLMEVYWMASSVSYGLPTRKTSKMETQHKRFLKITLDSTLEEMVQ